jgi:hypothetical protein
MFVFVALYFKTPQHQGPGPNEATLTHLRKSVIGIVSH